MKPTPDSGGNSKAWASVNEIATVRIELSGLKPRIWRKLEVPTSIALKVLHDIIQITVGWADDHLWEFRAGGRRYGPPMPEDSDAAPRASATHVRLRDVIGPSDTTIEYTYDFGDSWEHKITVSDVRAGDPEIGYPRYLGGERAGPPEDCGGVFGFEDMLAVRADPSHPDHAEILEYLDGYDPEFIDDVPIKYALRRIAARRNAARRSAAQANDKS